MKREMKEEMTMVKSDMTRGKIDNSLSQSKRKTIVKGKDERIIKAKEAEKELMSIVSALLSLKSVGRNRIHSDDCSSNKARKDDQEMKPKVKKTISLSAINAKNNVKYSGKERGNCRVIRSYNYRNYWVDKKIRVSADGLDKVDNFSWRSNGTKKLVGHSYFRRYYRCSKNGCSVHKIVDHDPNDPSMLIICYNGEHNHTIP